MSEDDSFRFEPEQWLWCLQCHRIFQGKDARRDAVGGAQGCAFPPCTGAGYGLDIHDLDQVEAREFLFKGMIADLWEEREREPPSGPGRVGASLNQNHALRDEILGIKPSEDPNTLTRFRGLDIVGLARLLRDRFLDPVGRHNDGPTAIECLGFLARCPEVRLHGYAVHPAREDSRVAIEGLHCELEGLSAARKERLRSAFALEWEYERDPDEYLNDGAQLFARWK